MPSITLEKRTTSDGGPWSTGVIVAVAVGGTAVLVIICVCIYEFGFRRRRHAAVPTSEKEDWYVGVVARGRKGHYMKRSNQDVDGDGTGRLLGEVWREQMEDGFRPNDMVRAPPTRRERPPSVVTMLDDAQVPLMQGTLYNPHSPHSRARSGSSLSAYHPLTVSDGPYDVLTRNRSPSLATPSLSSGTRTPSPNPNRSPQMLPPLIIPASPSLPVSAPAPEPIAMPTVSTSSYATTRPVATMPPTETPTSGMTSATSDSASLYSQPSARFRHTVTSPETPPPVPPLPASYSYSWSGTSTSTSNPTTTSTAALFKTTTTSTTSSTSGSPPSFRFSLPPIPDAVIRRVQQEGTEKASDLDRAPTKFIASLVKKRAGAAASKSAGNTRSNSTNLSLGVEGANLDRHVSKIERKDSIRSVDTPSDDEDDAQGVVGYRHLRTTRRKWEEVKRRREEREDSLMEDVVVTPA